MLSQFISSHHRSFKRCVVSVRFVGQGLICGWCWYHRKDGETPRDTEFSVPWRVFSCVGPHSSKVISIIFIMLIMYQFNNNLIYSLCDSKKWLLVSVLKVYTTNFIAVVCPPGSDRHNTASNGTVYFTLGLNAMQNKKIKTFDNSRIIWFLIKAHFNASDRPGRSNLPCNRLHPHHFHGALLGLGASADVISAVYLIHATIWIAGC